MGINLAYYRNLIETIKIALAVINEMKPVLIQLFQFAEDHMPESSGGDKLKYVMQIVHGLLDRSDEAAAKLDGAWDMFTTFVGAFASMQKTVGAVVPPPKA